MIIKWSDLMPKDKLRVNKVFWQEFCTKFGRQPQIFGGHRRMESGEICVVTDVEHDDESEWIYIHIEKYGSIKINAAGALWKLPEGPPMFEIISLSEEI